MSASWVFAWVFVLNAALAEALASFSGFRSFRILLPRAPSTITQYEYYSPLSPGSVQESLPLQQALPEVRGERSAQMRQVTAPLGLRIPERPHATTVPPQRRAPPRRRRSSSSGRTMK